MKGFCIFKNNTKYNARTKNNEFAVVRQICGKNHQSSQYCIKLQKGLHNAHVKKVIVIS